MSNRGKPADARDNSGAAVSATPKSATPNSGTLKSGTGAAKSAPRRARPKQAIVADVGGTTSRIAIAETGHPGRPLKLGPILKLANDDHESLDELLVTAIGELGAASVATAVFAVAGPVVPGDVALTNRPWIMRRTALAARFGWSRLLVVNDFAAVARALPRLTASDVVTLSPGRRDHGAPLLALGPGTGLGVGAFWPGFGGSGLLLASEAGHMSFGPSNPAENRIFAALQAGEGFVRAETVLCGPGLSRLYAAMVPEAGPLPAAAIAMRLAAGDAGARTVVSLFCSLLGRFAGDLALAFRAGGGVYLAGGVLQRLHKHADLAPLLAAFRAHPAHEAWLADVPVHVITAEEPGLIGCAVLAETETA